MIKVGDYVVIESWGTFFSCVKTAQAGRYFEQVFNRLIEDSEDLLYMEIVRKTNKTWKVTFICTAFNTYNLEEEEITLNSEVFDTKRLMNAETTDWLDDFGIEYSIKVVR